jgi:tetratricopeptide (TPR) repeat protein
MAGREDVFQKAMNQGHSAAWDQEWDKAIASYQKALKEFPDHPKALNSLGLALYQLQQYEEALKVYQQAVQITPDDPISLEKIAQLSERLGNLKTAVDSAMKAAEMYLNQRDVDKAIENWARVTQLDPEHPVAHSRLALMHERLGHNPQAVIEYLAVASLLQRSGNPEKTQELVDKALQLMPNNQAAKQAQTLLKSGQLLPKPMRPKGGTGPIRMAQVKQLESPKEPKESGLDPVAEARQKALTVLAEVLFEYSDDSGSIAQERRGMQSIVEGAGQVSLEQAEQTKIVLHLGQAIDSQTKGQDEQAAEELERALEAGFSHPALYFDLGLLRSQGERAESALRNLQHAVKHLDFALGTRILSGQIQRRIARLSEAAIEYLEALKIADSMVVPPEQSDEIRQLYEPLIDAQLDQTDEVALERLCKSVDELLMRKNWREHLRTMRGQLPKPQDGDLPLPLAETIIQAQGSQVLESMNHIHQLARDNRLRSAMDEAFQALNQAPTYLPLHTLIGDLLIKDDQLQDAITKFTVVAHAYSVRGEATQASKLLRKVIQLSPMDMAARTRLIDQLIEQGQVDDAINEYLDLADLYYRLAELDMARKTYTTALRLVQQTNADRTWNVHILQRMADIDMQHLDWKQALRIFEQIRTLKPGDDVVRKNLIDLNLRLGQQSQAIAELESYLSYMESNGRVEDLIIFLEDLLKDHEDQVFLRRALAELYQHVGRLDEAIAQLDTVGEALLNSGNRAGAIEAINAIVAMNPSNIEDYRKLLAQLQGG